MHHVDFEDRLEIDGNELVRVIKAVYKDKELDVIVEYPDGYIVGRNLAYGYMSGYLVSFPGEKERYRYGGGSYIVEEEQYSEICWSCNPTIQRSYIDYDLILKFDPNLRYLIKKIKNSNLSLNAKNMMLLINYYKEHPEIEALIEANQLFVALNKNLYRLKKEKRKQVINFIKNNKQYTNMTLISIQRAIKNNIQDYLEYCLFEECKDINLYKYLKKYITKEIKTGYELVSYYKDYIKMAKKAGHDVEELYWKYPKNLYQAHDKVLKECDYIDKAKDAILSNQFDIVCSKVFKGRKNDYGKYTISFPENYLDFAEQAKALKQCLISSGYADKLIQQKSILVFIKEDDKRIGTVEFDYNKKMLQAYGNEQDRSNCILPENLKEFAQQFVNESKIRKVNFKLPDNVFYKGLYEDDKSFNGHKFEEGKIYKTEFDNEIVEKTGGKCLASNKVYHFCKTIENVRAWVSKPESYAIVEALGPVVQKGTAFGSNKIKIKKIMDAKDVAMALLQANKVLSDAY